MYLNVAWMEFVWARERREKSSGLDALGDDGQDLLEQCLDYKARSCAELQVMIVMGRLGRSNDPERGKRDLWHQTFRKYPDCQSNPSFICPSFLMSNSFQQKYIIMQPQTCVCNVQFIILSHPFGSGRNGKRQLGASVPLEPFAIPFVAALPGDTIGPIGRHPGAGGSSKEQGASISCILKNSIRWLKHSLSTSSSCNKTCFCH